MTLRKKLSLYFVSITVLMIIMGAVFYFQLKNIENQLIPTNTAQGVLHAQIEKTHVILQKILDTTLVICTVAILASLLFVYLTARAMFYHLKQTTVLRDKLITEINKHKDTERRLEETAARLRESNMDLDQFAYAASHDLRSPLKAIESLATWIEEDCYAILPEKSRDNFNLIKRRVRRLNALIAGMLEYSRAGRDIQEQETVNLNQLLPEIIDNLAPPDTINIHIISILPIINTERAKLSQVFMNLIGNAIKYHDKKDGYINIGHKITGDYHQFYIEDNGCGIEQKFHEKIFEIFQTLHSRDTIESSGIGLAIVKKIIESKGGKIWLTSQLHEGTTFYFTWPIS